MKTVCGKRTDASSITDYCTDVFYRIANYGAGDYPEALLLHTDNESVVHVSYDGSYESAYLFAEPAEHECPNQAGFTPGWEC